MDEEKFPQQLDLGEKGRTEAPLPVKIFSVLIIIDGVIRLLGAIPFLFVVLVGPSLVIKGVGIFLLTVYIVIGVLTVVTGSGLRKMKRRSLRIFTFLAVFLILLFLIVLVNEPEFVIDSPVATLIVSLYTIMLIYFWSISKKFV